MKFAVSTADNAPITAPVLLLGDICDNLDRAYKLGYSAIEVHTRENVDLDYDKILSVCRKLNMKISSVVTGRLNIQEKLTLIDDDSTRVKAAMDAMKKYIDMARKLESNIIIGWVRGVLPDRGMLDVYTERLAENTNLLALYAANRGVKINIEALNRYETNYLNTGKEVVDFIERYDIPNTYVHLDTFHMNIEEENICDTIRNCSSKIGYIHFADSNRKYPGAGHLDFNKIIKAISDAGYRGYISVECLAQPTGEEAARLAIKNIQNLIEPDDNSIKEEKHCAG